MNTEITPNPNPDDRRQTTPSVIESDLSASLPACPLEKATPRRRRKLYWPKSEFVVLGAVLGFFVGVWQVEYRVAKRFHFLDTASTHTAISQGISVRRPDYDEVVESYKKQWREEDAKYNQVLVNGETVAQGPDCDKLWFDYALQRGVVVAGYGGAGALHLRIPYPQPLRIHPW